MSQVKLSAEETMRLMLLLAQSPCMTDLNLTGNARGLHRAQTLGFAKQSKPAPVPADT